MSAPLVALRFDIFCNSFKCWFYWLVPNDCLFLFFFPEIILQDHIERGNIDFRSLKFRVLDEADEMLRMGFVEDVELILGMSLIYYIDYGLF